MNEENDKYLINSDKAGRLVGDIIYLALVVVFATILGLAFNDPFYGVTIGILAIAGGYLHGHKLGYLKYVIVQDIISFISCIVVYFIFLEKFVALYSFLFLEIVFYVIRKKYFEK